MSRSLVHPRVASERYTGSTTWCQQRYPAASFGWLCGSGRIARSRTPPLHLVPPHPHSVEDTTTSTKSPSDSTATHNPKKHLFGPALMGWSAQGAPGLTTDFYQTEKAFMTPSLPWRINGKLGLVRERYPEGVFYGSAKHTSGPGITMHCHHAHSRWLPQPQPLASQCECDE